MTINLIKLFFYLILNIYYCLDKLKLKELNMFRTSNIVKIQMIRSSDESL